MSSEVSSEPPPGLVAAQRIAIASAEYAVRTAEAGVSEHELAVMAEEHARSLGAIGCWTETAVGFGMGSLRCWPTEPPTNRTLWNLDVGHIDIGPISSDGWWGDSTRTLVRGDVPEYREMLSEMENVQRLLHASVRPGMRACELHGIYAAECTRLGVLPLDRISNIGHSLDREAAYDLGYIDAHNETAMWAAWAVEPFFGNYLFGVKLEDVVWFGSDHCTVVS